MNKLCFLIPLFVFLSCANGFLDVKPSIRQRVPKTLNDYISLLDNTSVMNVSSHALGMIGGDEIFISEPVYNAFPTGANYNYLKRAYVWEENIFEGNEVNLLDWNDGYKRILWANLALDGIERLTGTEKESPEAAWAKGAALFHRAFNYYNLAQLFCPVFDPDMNAPKSGLPLRLDPDLTMSVPRSNLQETYERIAEDISDALKLLPDDSENIYRPDKAAALALLARLQLQMGNYQAAFDNAEQCLARHGSLLDYDTVNPDQPLPFTSRGIGNPEIIFMSMLTGNMGSYLRMLSVQAVSVNPDLIALYEAGDLRRTLFYGVADDGSFNYRGSYDGYGRDSYFTGLATDEVYLILAETAARLGNIPKALVALNRLRKHRFLPVEFRPLEISDVEILLDSIVVERRRELVLRGIRWEDLRRLNKEERFAETLTRKLGERTFTLEPGSKRYVWPLPLEAVQVGGYEQNIR